jgi:hypothetical protein
MAKPRSALDDGRHSGRQEIEGYHERPLRQQSDSQGNRVNKSPSVILAVRGRLLPEFGGDPEKEGPKARYFVSSGRLSCWIPDTQHACSFSPPLRWGARSVEDDEPVGCSPDRPQGDSIHRIG